MERLSINKWAEDDRPREKLMSIGINNLSNAELLAILIGSGSREESAVDLMKRIMNDCNQNLNTLGKMSLEELMRYKGIGEAKAISILAASELGKRRSLQSVEEQLNYNSSDALYALMKPVMQDITVEEMWVIMLNNNLKLIKKERISVGGITQTVVDIRVMMKKALLNNATAIAICHNHPSNNTEPSKQDNTLTKNVQEACKLLQIYFVDHIIFAENGYYSYADEGLLFSNT